MESEQEGAARRAKHTMSSFRSYLDDALKLKHEAAPYCLRKSLPPALADERSEQLVNTVTELWSRVPIEVQQLEDIVDKFSARQEAIKDVLIDEGVPAPTRVSEC